MKELLLCAVFRAVETFQRVALWAINLTVGKNMTAPIARSDQQASIYS
ncbi:hypothetical protein [Xanthovirga aplysinae]|nr:hypothetical protein [Xanthovirga aplysinae]